MCREQLDFALELFSPKEISSNDRAAFVRMVLEGGEVDPRTLPHLIDRAVALALLRMGGELVGVGGVKRPYDSHRRGVFELAKANVRPDHYPLEIGWIYVSPRGRDRRFGSRILEKLMPSLKGASAYATSRVNNDRMHSSLRRFGFESIGVPYPSKQGEPNIQLFVHTTAATTA